MSARTPQPLSADHIEELEAVAETTAALGKPTFMHKSHWHGLYDTLVGRRLVTWDRFRDGSFGPDFRSVQLTDKGRAALTTTEAEK